MVANLPDDNEALKSMVGALRRERDDLHIENLRLQVELDGYKKRYYGPRADRLQSADDLAQLLLNFADEIDRKPINADDVPPHSEPQEQLRRVKRRKGRRHLANFENLPVTTHVYELYAAQRACPCCGDLRKEIGAEESWQVEYLPGHFERLHHVRKKYACPVCETNGDHPQIETAVKPEAVIEKGMAGPGLLAYIVTSKFSDYLPTYRLEDIFARQGFEISRATQSSPPNGNKLTVQRLIEGAAICYTSQTIYVDKFLKRSFRSQQRLFNFEFPALNEYIERTVANNRQERSRQSDVEMRAGRNEANANESHGEENWASASDRADEEKR